MSATRSGYVYGVSHHKRLSVVDNRKCTRRMCVGTVCKCQECNICGERCSLEELEHSPHENKLGIWIGPHCLMCEIRIRQNEEDSSSSASESLSSSSDDDDDDDAAEFEELGDFDVVDLDLCQCATCREGGIDGNIYVRGHCIWTQAAFVASASVLLPTTRQGE